jgi:hypothetical protein
MSGVGWRWVLAGALTCVVACGSSSAPSSQGTSDGGGDTTAGGSDASTDTGGDDATSDSSIRDGSGDGSHPADGGADSVGPPADGGDGGVSGYSDITDTSKWTKFNLAPLGLDHGALLWGAAFDGRFMYFPAYQTGFYDSDGSINELSGLVVQLDTQGTFTSVASWATFDTAVGGGQAYTGAVFDGRYVHFLPNQGTVASRYDTKAPFGTASSWAYATTGGSFAGGTCDGQNVYAAPYLNTTTAMRYGAVDGGTGWSKFDEKALDASVGASVGAAFDGRYVYFGPNGFNVADGVVTRYDSQAPFGSLSSWSDFDVSATNPAAKGFAGLVFDGRYLYLVPYYDGTAYSGLVTRYDTTAPFASSSSWESFDVNPSTSGNGFIGGVFDGRYVYFVPFFGNRLVRYDTLGTFGDAMSWGWFDTTKLDPLAYQFHGGAFDGRYLYLPSQYGVVVRFDAKSPPSLPGTAHGSYF